MLVLRRLEGERIIINDDIVVTLLVTDRKSAKIGIEAPKHINITRDEPTKNHKTNPRKKTE